jgi:hypothetical protein
MYEKKNFELGKRSQASCYCLHYWEEVIDTLERVWKENDSLNAKIGDIIVILPVDIEDKLLPLIGKCIGILRTDIPQKEYLVCSISESKSLSLKEEGSIRSTPNEISQEADRGKARA